MPTWVKVLTVLTTLPPWIAAVVVSLARGEIPSAEFMAIPAVVIGATTGTDIVIKRRKASNDSD